MTDQDKIFDDYVKELEAFHKDVNDHNTIILKKIRKELGGKYVNDIKACLEESEAHGKLEIVDNPGIKRQDEDWRTFDHILVDQYENGGYEGDSFAGWIYIPLKDNKYLKSHYSM